MTMKKFSLFVFLFATNVFAGQVHQLNPGQTLPLSDGSIVACMGDAPVQTAKLYRCKVIPQGSPVLKFCGISSTSGSALAQARSNCLSGLVGNAARQQFCSSGWQNYSCEEINPVDAGICN